MSVQAIALEGSPARIVRKSFVSGVAVLAVAAVIFGVGVVLVGGDEASDLPPGVYSIQSGHLLYAYHRLSNSDSLFDLQSDPGCQNNLSHRLPRQALELRRTLSKQLGVQDLVELPFEFTSGPA